MKSFDLRDQEPITFVTLSGFCLLSKAPPHPPASPQFLMGNIKVNGVPTKINKIACPFYIVPQVLKVLLVKICKTQPPDN